MTMVSVKGEGDVSSLRLVTRLAYGVNLLKDLSFLHRCATDSETCSLSANVLACRC